MNGNRLSGTISEKIRNLGRLRRISLRENQLSGRVPYELFQSDPGVLDVRSNNFLPEDLVDVRYRFDGLNQYFPQNPLEAPDTLFFDPCSHLYIYRDLCVKGGEGNYTIYKDGEAFLSTKEESSICYNFIEKHHQDGSWQSTYRIRVQMPRFESFYVETNPIHVVPSLPTDLHRQILIDLYQSTNGGEWENNTGWDTTATEIGEDWYGITLENGLVTKIELANNGLYGNIPASLSELGACIQKIDLSYNRLSGTIPESFSNLRLDTLDLSHNQLQGIIPSGLDFGFRKYGQSLNEEELVEISPLVLDLSHNQLVGIYLDSGKELSGANLSHNHIRDLSISSEFIRGANLAFNMLNFESIISKSLALDFSANLLMPQQEFPVGQDTVQLDINDLLLLRLHMPGEGNQYQWFREGLPVTATLDTAQYVVLQADPTHSGSYVCEVTNPTVPGLTLRFEPIRVIVRGVPEVEYQALVALYEALRGSEVDSLRSWTLEENTVSNQWYGIQVRDNHVVGIDLSHLQLAGNLPEEIGNLVYLEELNLADNALYGSLPSSIIDLEKLRALWLNNNQLTGSLPTEIGNLTLLQILQAQHNRFSGVLPNSLGQMRDLRELLLFDNQLVGAIPEGLKFLSRLEKLWLSQNQLATLPNLSHPDFNPELVVFENRLDFGDLLPNQALFSTSAHYVPQDTIDQDSEVINLISGDDLWLSVSVGGIGNDYQWFRDGEPISLVADNAEFFLEEILEADSGLYHCVIKNSLLPDLELLTKSVRVNIAPIPSRVSEREYQALVAIYEATQGDNWIDKQGWDLANNNVDNNWYGVTVENQRVVKLELAQNHLLGSLPAAIGDLIHLEQLDLSGNQIQGSLPQEIAQLENLQVINLNDNEINHLENIFSGAFTGLVSVSNNRLDFGDLEVYSHYFANSSLYSPQAKLAVEDTFLLRNAGEAIELGLATEGLHNFYRWLKDGEYITNFSEDSILNLAPIFGRDSGIYTTEVRNELVPGLVLYSRNVEVVVDGITGLPQQFSQGSLSLFPNPTDQYLQIELRETPFAQEGRILIYDPQGRERLDFQFDPSETIHKLDVAHLPAGLYQVLIEINGEQVYRKLLKL